MLYDPEVKPRYISSRILHSGIPERYKDAELEDKSKYGDSYKVVLIGDVGVGKTYCACALGKGFIENQLGTVKYLFFPDLLDEIKKSFNSNQDAILEKYADIDLLILDDLGAEKPSEWVSEKVNQIIDDRYRNNKRLIITTNLSMSEMRDRFGARNTDRIIEYCQVFRLKGGNRRLKID